MYTLTDHVLVPGWLSAHPLQESGVQLSDGDGTCPLISLGPICEGGWRTKRLNPGGSLVVVKEFPNDPLPVFKDPR